MKSQRDHIDGRIGRPAPFPAPGVYSAEQLADRPSRRGNWCQTYTGKQYWPLDPRPEEIDPVDVAHHLSLLCRFTGACRVFYSVAEHSVHVSHLVERHLQRFYPNGLPGEDKRNLTLRALLHDGPEFMLNDMNRPTKYAVEGYREIESANWQAFCVRFKLDVPDHDGVVKLADNAMLLAEQGALMAPSPEPWAPIEVPAEMLADARERLATGTRYRWPWYRAEMEFMARYRELVAK